jgi:hypothetical protein
MPVHEQVETNLRRGSRFEKRWGLLPLLACLGALMLASLTPADGASQVRLLSERPVPPQMTWAFDIRWASEASVLIAAGKAGVFEISAATAHTG